MTHGLSYNFGKWKWKIYSQRKTNSSMDGGLVLFKLWATSPPRHRAGPRLTANFNQWALLCLCNKMIWPQTVVGSSYTSTQTVKASGIFFCTWQCSATFLHICLTVDVYLFFSGGGGGEGGWKILMDVLMRNVCASWMLLAVHVRLSPPLCIWEVKVGRPPWFISPRALIPCRPIFHNEMQRFYLCVWF